MTSDTSSPITLIGCAANCGTSESSPRAQDVAPRRAADRERTVPLDPAAEAHADLIATSAAGVRHQVDVAAGDWRAVRVGDDAADARHAPAAC
jgi:hypothetical protein